jgi:hypothetical protein
MCAHTFENHVGILFIKRDGVRVYNGTGEIILMHFSLILFGSIIYVNSKGFNVDYILGTTAHYELRATV